MGIWEPLVSQWKYLCPPKKTLSHQCSHSSGQWPEVLCRAGVSRNRSWTNLWLQITWAVTCWKMSIGRYWKKQEKLFFWASSTGSRASTKWSWNELEIKISLCLLAGSVASQNCYTKMGVSTSWIWNRLQLNTSQSYKKLECSVTGIEITCTEQQQHLSSQLCRSWSSKTEPELSEAATEVTWGFWSSNMLDPLSARAVGSTSISYPEHPVTGVPISWNCNKLWCPSARAAF